MIALAAHKTLPVPCPRLVASTRCEPHTRKQRAVRSKGRVFAAATDTEPSPDIEWDDLGFGLQHVADTMYVSTCLAGESSWSGSLRPYGPMSLYPSAQVLNYGQSVFEGMKAQRTEEGHIVLFRPDCNAQRMQDGAARLSMACPSTDEFVAAVESVVRANARMVPPKGKGSLYLRPLLMGTGPILGLGPAPEYTFCVYCAAVGAYFKGGQLTPIDLKVDTQFHRSAPRGMGGTKAAGNYSPVLVQQLAAKKEGYSDVLYLDAAHDKYLEEVSSCNIFVKHGNVISTPPISGSILPGVTRRSVVELARSKGYEVREEPVSIEMAMEADEVFTTGTAVVLSPVGSLTYKGERRQFGEPGVPTATALELYEALTGLQQERIPDDFGWVHRVC
jgi:branched-chain amino acid aminotransferase